MSRHGSGSSHEENVLPFARPRRPRSTKLPEHLVTASEASVRATEVYARLLHDRLEHARRARVGGGLGRLDASALQRVIAASDALQHACEDALAQIDRQIATRARLVAQAAAERVPSGRR
ncbi:MAG TPA: hypothetical protein VFG31_06185 [Conexibacter sp.]|nr:hypothetical protein [Conexibacter sp.]